MQLQNIAFRGYKAFPGGDPGADHDEEWQRLDLAPLTLVFGKNNSGKSAVVRLPRLLLGGLACRDERILPLEDRGLRFGDRFVDIVHGGSFLRRPGFEIRAIRDPEELHLAASFYTDPLAGDQPPKVWSYRMLEPEKVEFVASTSHPGERPILQGLLPGGSRWDAWRDAASAVLDGMVHLGPMRASIALSYPEQQPEKLGFGGRQAPQWLRVDGELEEVVGDWFEEHMDGWRISLSRSNEGFHLRVGMRGSGEMKTNLARAGEGLQQVLPVVVHQWWRRLRSADPFLDIVEQPELHLHAAAQAPLADLFIETALQAGERGRLIVETHSEPLLLRVQRRIAEGKLPLDKVALYFVEVTAKGSRLRRIQILPNGEVEWWPEGVFEESFHEVAAMRRAQRRAGDGEME